METMNADELPLVGGGLMLLPVDSAMEALRILAELQLMQFLIREMPID